MEITIDSIATSKVRISICRKNANNTLTVTSAKVMNITHDFDAGTTTCVYQGKAYAVKGTIYMQYIVVNE